MSHRTRPSLRRRVAVRSAVGLTTCLLGASFTTGLVGPPQTSKPHVERVERALADRAEAGWSKTIDLKLPAEMVGFTWDQPSAAAIHVRGQRADRTWTEWIDLGTEGAEGPDLREAPHASGTAGPAWLGRNVRAVQIELRSGTLDHLVLHEIDSRPVVPSGVGPASASALPGPPGIVTRAQWGADESWRSANADCGTPRIASNATYAVLHHTAGSNDYAPSDSAALIRGIYQFHVFGNGWCDIAYNFLVDKYGQTFEGRYGGIFHAVIGGHSGGFNTGSIGVSVLGDLSSVPMSDRAFDSVVSLLTFKLGHHGIDPWGTAQVTTVDHPSSRFPPGQVIQVQSVVPHGDLTKTGCPGRLRERITAMRTAAAARIASDDRDTRLMADWNGDGSSTPGVYQNGTFYFRNSNVNGPVEQSVHYGTASYVPVVGDWDGNGTDTVGVYVNGMWYLRNSNTPGPAEIVIHYGMAGYTPVVGNWDGLGGDGIGVFEGGRWHLRTSLSAGPATFSFAYGDPGYKPVVGDWDATGGDGIGVFVGGTHYLKNLLVPGRPDTTVAFGTPKDRAVAGDWDGDGRDTIGINRGAYWYLRDTNADGPADRIFWF